MSDNIDKEEQDGLKVIGELIDHLLRVSESQLSHSVTLHSHLRSLEASPPSPLFASLKQQLLSIVEAMKITSLGLIGTSRAVKVAYDSREGTENSSTDSTGAITGASMSTPIR